MSEDRPWYTREWVGLAIIGADLVITAWFLLGGWLHNREHRRDRTGG